MASIKIVLRKNMMRKDNTIPLAIRISENYKTNYKWLGQYVLEKDWDKNTGRVKRTHPNAKKLNNFLLKKLTETNDIYFDSKENITPKQVKQKLKGAGGSKSFFVFAADRVKRKYEREVFSVAKSELSILFGKPTTIVLTFSFVVYSIKKSINVSEGTVLSPEAIIHNSSVTAIPVFFNPKSIDNIRPLFSKNDSFYS